jgi:polyhydroxyalkanoate synthase
MPATPEQWFQGAEQHVGSWWGDWQAWMERQNAGEKVPARVPGERELKVIEHAPGSYAMLHLGPRK